MIVVDHDDPVHVEPLPPADHDLAVDQPLVNAKQHDRHAPPPRVHAPVIPPRPFSTSRSTSSASGRSAVEDEVQEHGEVDPADDPRLRPVQRDLARGEGAAAARQVREDDRRGIARRRLPTAVDEPLRPLPSLDTAAARSSSSARDLPDGGGEAVRRATSGR